MTKYEENGMNGCTISETHCEQCGETSGEFVGYAALRESEGYSGCCNELVAYSAAECRNHHGEDAR